MRLFYRILLTLGAVASVSSCSSEFNSKRLTALNLGLSVQGSLVAGEDQTFEVVIRDKSGTVKQDYSGTVVFESTDPRAVLPAPYTFTPADGGSRTFTAKFLSAGEQTVTVIDTSKGSTVSATVETAPAPTSKFTLSGIPPSASACVDYELEVRAEDAYGNVTPDYDGSVRFSATDGTAVLPGDYTFGSGDAGVRRFSGVRLGGIGSWDVVAQDLAAPAISGQLAAATTAGPLAAFVVDNVQNPVPVGFDSAVRVTARDACGNTIAGYRGTVAFSSDDTGASLPGNYAFTSSDSGVHSFAAAVRFASAGTKEVRVSDLAQPSAAGTQSVTVVPAISIVPSSISLAVNNTQVLGAAGGVGPYSYSIVSGGGSISGTTYTAPATAGTATVRVTDSLGMTSDAAVTISGPLVISPTSVTLAVNNTRVFSASGGVAPYSYSVVSGGGSFAGTTYTAPGAAGSATVRVTDSLGNTSDATVTINPALAISPATVNLAVNNTRIFSATGGVGPYIYTIVAGGGSISGATYTAPSAPGTATVRVTDALGNTSDAAVSIGGAVAISPSSVTLAVTNTQLFSVTGGVGPYTYSVVSGGGSFGGATYTAPAAAGTATVRVTDSLGNTSDATVTINAALAISPASVTLAVNNTRSFSATGGVGPYTYSVVAGGGSFSGSTYTAPAAAGSATVRVTDSLGNTSDATVTINAALAISPASVTLAVNNTRLFSASGGVGPYTYSVVTGGGSFSGATYTAPGTTGTATVRVTDSLGNTSDAAVTINAALAIAPASSNLLAGSTQGYNATGGVGPYSYSVVSGGGSFSGATYTAPAGAASVTVRVTDSLGNTSDASVNVYTSLAINPASITLAVNNTRLFSASGGVAPFTYSVVSGGGSFSGATYTAPAASGSATVRVTDSIGNTSDATVTINAALAISPTTVTLAVNNTRLFSATGGVAPYTYSVVSGGGSFSGATYTAPAAAGSATVRVTDSLGNTSDAAVTINAALAISPASVTLAVNNSRLFSAIGGVAPYTYSVIAGGGSFSGATYTAPAAAGSATVRVTDSLGNTSNASVTINAALTISPASVTVAVNNSFLFTESGGVGPYTYSVVSGGGTFTVSTYTAPAAAGSATVRVTDSLGNTSDAAVTINSALAISPTSVTLAVNNTRVFSESGGVAPFTYSVVSGGGSFSGATYTAPGAAGTATVRVTDLFGNTSDATVTINAALAISPASVTLTVNGTNLFAASGGVGPYAYSVVSGAGSFSGATYTAPGTPGSATVRVTDSLANTSAATVTINDVVPSGCGYASTPVVYTKDLAITDNLITCSGGGAPVSFSISPSLNANTGLSFDTSTGRISGTPTIASSATAYTVTVTNTGGSAAASVNIAVLDPVPTGCAYSPSSVTYTKGVSSANAVPSCSGGSAPTSFALSGTPALVTGLSFNTTTGAITGTPTALQTAGATYSVTASNAGGTSSAFTLTITVNDVPPSTLSYTSTPVLRFFAGMTSAKNLATVTGGGPATSFSASPALPAGLTLNASTGEITGVPSIAGSGTYQLSATNSGGSATHDLNIIVEAAALAGGKASISVGGSNACAIASGGLLCWGQNTYGEVGDGTTVTKNSPTPVTGLGSGVQAVSAGYQHTCAIASGAAYCWGRNANGQLGTGDTVNSLTPVAVPGLNSGVQAIAAGMYHTCAIQNGAVKCWGNNGNGELGDNRVGNGLTPVQASGLTSGVTAITAHWSKSCAIHNGAAKCWGEGRIGNGTSTYSPVPAQVTGMTSGVQAIATGNNHSCAVMNGAAYCWGDNAQGQLGDNSTTTALSPVAVQGLTAGVQDISAGSSVSCAIVNGAAKCWGSGIGLVPGQVSGLTGGVQQVVSHISQNCALVNSAMKCWAGVSAPSQISGLSAGIREIATGGYHTCALINGGVQCTGYGFDGELGNGLTSMMSNVFVQSQLTTGVQSVRSAGAMHTCAIVNGGAQCWGQNGEGRLGNNSTAFSGFPVQVQGLTAGVQALAVGGGHTCAIVNGGALCWGEGTQGALGNNAAADSLLPVQVQGLTSGVQDIAAGGSPNTEVDFTCAVVNGAAQCWGYNNRGQLGDGTTVTKYVPTPVSGLGSGVTAIVTGNNHACALVNGGVQCWGDNSYGQLGDNTTVYKTVPVQVSGLTSGVTAITAGNSHTCAIVDGASKCWGFNGSGELGNLNNYNTTGGAGAAKSLVPISMDGLGFGVDQVSGGASFTCTLASGAVYCAGAAGQGQYGANSTVLSPSPVPAVQWR